ncbi:Peroxidasin [Gryllus bimaculatus]|nr:Peroxidasin [Gryllus bimaculatus]
MNRIREVPAGAFARYPSLELLYLDDNAVAVIEDGALDPLASLRVLSLALNSIVEVPRSLLRLPSLQRLVLSRNPLAPESLAAALAAAPEDGPLQVLALASCRLRALPPLQRLPRLRELNVSGNPLDKVSAAQLAPLCSLRVAALGDAHATVDFCDCVLLREWSERDGLQLHPPQALDCAGRDGEPAEVARCANSSAAREAQALRAQCGRTLQAQERDAQRRRLWAKSCDEDEEDFAPMTKKYTK